MATLLLIFVLVVRKPDKKREKAIHEVVTLVAPILIEVGAMLLAL